MIKFKLQYPTLSALVDTAMGSSDMPLSERISRGDTNGTGWAGATWNEAKQAALYGDIVGAKKLAPAILNSVKQTVLQSPRFDPEFRLDGGSSIDVARFVKGEPECWLEMVETGTMPKQGIAVIVNLTTNGGMRASQLEAAGIAIGSAIIGLQSRGIAVTLYVSKFIARPGQSDRALISAPLNPNGCLLDVSKLSVIIRPWMTRRILFSLYETRSAEFRKTFGVSADGFYGSTQGLTTEAKALIAPNDKTVIAIEMSQAYQDPKSVLRRIERAINY